MDTSPHPITAPTYDELPYDGYAYWFTHPDHLWVMAHARHLAPAPPERARVLELGCGDGGNLLSLAASLPEATFVGLDLSVAHIERARALAVEASLPNAAFIQGDFDAVPPSGGPFDYIIAHGVYSWVPPAARDRLFAAISRHLARTGVALVSFNAWPGQHDLEPVRELMRLHTAAIADPQAKIRQARNIARLWAHHLQQRQSDLRGAVAQRITSLIEGASDQIIRHDWLSEEERPSSLSEVAAHAERHGLAWFDNALPASQRPENLDDDARTLLLSLPRGLRQQQYLDYFDNTRFRVGLFCHADQVVPQDPEAPQVAGFALDRLADLSVESRLDFDPWTPESRFRPSVLVETPSGYLEVSGAPLRIALSTLFHHAPRAVAIDRLFEEVREQLVAEHQDGGLADTDEGLARLRGLLVTELVGFWTRELVHFWRSPPNLPSPRRIPTHPRTTPLIRHLAARGRFIPNLAHRHCELDPPRLALLTALDGGSDVDSLVRRFGPTTGPLLDALARQALLLPD